MAWGQSDLFHYPDIWSCLEVISWGSQTGSTEKEEEWAVYRMDAGEHPETKEWKLYGFFPMYQCIVSCICSLMLTLKKDWNFYKMPFDCGWCDDGWLVGLKICVLCPFLLLPFGKAHFLHSWEAQLCYTNPNFVSTGYGMQCPWYIIQHQCRKKWTAL